MDICQHHVLVSTMSLQPLTLMLHVAVVFAFYDQSTSMKSNRALHCLLFGQ